MLNTILSYMGPSIAVILQILLCVIVSFGVYFAKKLIKKLNININDATLKEIEEIVKKSVLMTNQILVDNYKAMSSNGKLTDEQKEEAYTNTYNTIISILSSEQIEFLKEKYNCSDVSNIIEMLIESTISNYKSNETIALFDEIKEEKISE